MKTIERVAGIVAVGACNDDISEEIAQEIIDSLGIIILPKDAEPEDNDLIKCYDILDDGFKIPVAFRWKELKNTCVWADRPEGTKIIQRNGHPVIMEEE